MSSDVSNFRAEPMVGRIHLLNLMIWSVIYCLGNLIHILPLL